MYFLNCIINCVKPQENQMKMSFNPDQTKQAQEFIFSKKKSIFTQFTHPSFFFSNSEIKLSSNQKHLEPTLGSKLSFNEHTNDKIHQDNKVAGLFQKLETIIPRISLLTIYKSFIRLLLYYADLTYDQLPNALFSIKIELVQYDTALAIAGAIKSCSCEKLYQELGLECLDQRVWTRRLCLL